IYLEEFAPKNRFTDIIEVNINNLAAVPSIIFGLFPDVTGRERRNLSRLTSNRLITAEQRLREMAIADPSLIGTTQRVEIIASGVFDQLEKGFFDVSLGEGSLPFYDNQLGWWNQLKDDGRIVSGFNTTLLSGAHSSEAELAGIYGALIGSFLTLTVTLALAFPIGVAAAIYLEEFAPKNRFTDIIEVNINNLAAVPSIIFGLLGLAMLINFFGVPRSTPLVGGMVLALMTLPTVIIAARAALKAVPPSIREAALAVGASKVQSITHHVLPLAMPGILTGTIIGMAQALGETAPLLLIGMNAYIASIPGGFTDVATVLPVQIFIWANEPARAFVERTSAGIMVLLTFLVAMNLLAVLLRKRFERRW
ncbi:MAG: phosphate ABC transporter permease PstA, partial [Pseudomonadota bacterium]